MRIPNGLRLEGKGWHIALLSLSLPNSNTTGHPFAKGVDNTIIRFKWSALAFSGYSAGKYSSVALYYFETNVVESDIASSADGVSFWKTAIRTLNDSVDDQLVTHRNANVSHDLFVKETMCPTFVWDGDDLLIKKRGEDVTDRSSPSANLYSAVDIALEVAIQWGLVQEVDDGTWVVGPNLSWTPFHANEQINDSYPPRVSSLQTPGNLATMNGVATRLRRRLDIPVTFYGRITALATGANNFQLLWYYEAGNQKWIRLTGMVEWRISNIRRTFTNLNKHPNHSVMVYSNLQQATIVGEKTVQLLREIVVNRSAEDGHSYAEPKQLQWIPVASNSMDIAEVQIADVNGPLLSLPPGKSLITVAFQQMV